MFIVNAALPWASCVSLVDTELLNDDGASSSISSSSNEIPRNVGAGGGLLPQGLDPGHNLFPPAVR